MNNNENKEVKYETTAKTYRVPYIVLYDGTSHSRTVEVPALTSQEARQLAEVKINNLEPEADSFELYGHPEVIV